jgi:MYXO-CTERM domain-containing protein
MTTRARTTIAALAAVAVLVPTPAAADRAADAKAHFEAGTCRCPQQDGGTSQDGGADDGGTSQDGGADDGGTDGGAGDGGADAAGTDGGAGDGGASDAAGGDAAPKPTSLYACQCRTGAAAAPPVPALLLLAALAGLRRRRR